MTLDMVRMLTCETHGVRKWQGHIMCHGCGLVFQTGDAKASRFAPATCTCGQQLMPPKDEQIGDPLGLHISGKGAVISTDGTIEEFATHDSKDWMARPICYLCFRRISKKHGGRIPGWGGEEWQSWDARKKDN